MLDRQGSAAGVWWSCRRFLARVGITASGDRRSRGPGRSRTGHLPLATRALYQMSYEPQMHNLASCTKSRRTARYRQRRCSCHPLWS